MINSDSSYNDLYCMCSINEEGPLTGQVRIQMSDDADRVLQTTSTTSAYQ